MLAHLYETDSLRFTFQCSLTRDFPGSLTGNLPAAVEVAAYTNTAIAEKLVLSPKTVRNQVSNIFGKLQVASRSEAIVKARDADYGQ